MQPENKEKEEFTDHLEVLTNTKKSILILNGPNLNMLGKRNRTLYGEQTLSQIHENLNQLAQELGVNIEFLQSNEEAFLIQKIQEAAQYHSAIILNPAGYGHTSVALRDTIQDSPLPVIELHLSNISARENFRQQTLTSSVCYGIISGFGALGYELALQAAVSIDNYPKTES